MPATTTFDPLAVTEEQLDALTRAQLREVIAAYELPDQPKGAGKDDLLRTARVAIRAAHPPALEAGAIAPAEEAIVPLERSGAPSVVPAASRWQIIKEMAEYLSKSNLTPEALRGPGKVNDLGAVLLRANDLGIPLTAALDTLYVIKGKVGMEAKLMRALARRDGHHISDDPASDKFQAIVHGVRADNGDAGTATFDLDDAKAYGLIDGYDRHDDGSVTIRGNKAKPQWTTDPANMLKNRATSRLCRDLFSDSLAGVSYTPDELEGFIDSDDGAAPQAQASSEATITLEAQRSQIGGRIEDLPADLKDGLRAEWKKRNLPSPAKLTAAGVRTALGLLEPVERDAAERVAQMQDAIEDAELVDEPAESAGDAGEPGPGDGPARDEQDAAAASPAPPPADEGTVVCAACGDVIPGTEDDPVLYDDQQRPHHTTCMPF